MADQTLNTLVGGGEFVSRRLSGVQIIPSGSTGVLALITPAAGNRIRLNTLTWLTNNANNITIKVGGTTVVDDLLLGANTTVTALSFSIGYYSDTRARDSSAPYLQGDYNEEIEISSLSATSGDLYFNYTEGK